MPPPPPSFVPRPSLPFPSYYTVYTTSQSSISARGVGPIKRFFSLLPRPLLGQPGAEQHLIPAGVQEKDRAAVSPPSPQSCRRRRGRKNSFLPSSSFPFLIRLLSPPPTEKGEREKRENLFCRPTDRKQGAILTPKWTHPRYTSRFVSTTSSIKACFHHNDQA